MVVLEVVDLNVAVAGIDMVALDVEDVGVVHMLRSFFGEFYLELVGRTGDLLWLEEEVALHVEGVVGGDGGMLVGQMLEGVDEFLVPDPVRKHHTHTGSRYGLAKLHRPILSQLGQPAEKDLLGLFEGV